LLCLACQQGVEQPVLVAQVAQDYSAEDMAMFSRASDWDSSEDTFADLS
jgi:hypothetical protein